MTEGTTVFVVDDDQAMRDSLRFLITSDGLAVECFASAEEFLDSYSPGRPGCLVLDVRMPKLSGLELQEKLQEDRFAPPVVLITGHGDVPMAVRALKAGAFDFIEKPLSLAKLLRTVEAALESAGRQSRAATNLLPSLLTPVGRSAVMQALRERVQQYARHDGPVLISGESGTGRGAFARYMHALSRRTNETLTSLTAASVTQGNAEQQLLGSEGDGQVITGAFERAAEGTLVIDELSDLSSSAQKILLGVIEDGRFTRIGGSETVKLKARIVATVGADYEALIEAGILRRDLVSQVNVLSLRVPPLRDYSEDVPALLTYYVDNLVDAEGLTFRRFSVAAQNRLRNYPWPDNVRELKHLVRRLLLSGSGEDITLEDVEAEISASAPVDEPLVKQDLLALPLREAREHFERAYLQQQLVLCNGKVGQLAKRVGMERTHLYRKLRSLGVDFKSISSDDAS